MIVKACQNCIRPGFVVGRKDVRLNNANLDKNKIYMFYKIDWCAAKPEFPFLPLTV